MPAEDLAALSPSTISSGEVTVQTVRTGARASIVVLVNNSEKQFQAHALTTSSEALQSFSRHYVDARIVVSDSFIEIVPADGQKGLVLATRSTAQSGWADFSSSPLLNTQSEVMMFDRHLSVISTRCSGSILQGSNPWSMMMPLGELAGEFSDSIALFRCGSGGEGASSCSNGTCSVGCNNGYYACCGVVSCTCQRAFK